MPPIILWFSVWNFECLGKQARRTSGGSFIIIIISMVNAGIFQKLNPIVQAIRQINKTLEPLFAEWLHLLILLEQSASSERSTNIYVFLLVRVS